MVRVTGTLTVETTRESDDAHRFALVAEGADVTAHSTSTYASQADAVVAGTRMTDGGSIDAQLVEREDGWAVRLANEPLEAMTPSWPDRAQAEAVLQQLSG